ncbi:MAG: hypothetical protein ACYTAN_14545 [Planctomycetota bacterium]
MEGCVQTEFAHPAPFGPPVSVQWQGLTINYRTEGDVAAGPLVPLDPWAGFLNCFLGPGETGIEFVDHRAVMSKDGYVFWISRQTIENAAKVSVCRDWDQDGDRDVDLRDLAAQQNWLARLRRGSE